MNDSGTGGPGGPGGDGGSTGAGGSGGMGGHGGSGHSNGVPAGHSAATIQELVYGNPSLRRRVYAGYAIVGFVLGATQVGVSAAEVGQPVALTVAMAIYTFAGSAFGLTARSKVNAIIQ